MARPIVTLFELYGAGAEEIGPKVADALEVPWEPQAFTSASIEAAETALRELEDELADPGTWSTPEKSERAGERHEEAKRRLAELYAEWEEAEAAVSAAAGPA